MLVSQTQYSRDDAQHDRQDRGHALIATYWNNMIDQYTDTDWYHIQVRFGEFASTLEYGCMSIISMEGHHS